MQNIKITLLLVAVQNAFSPTFKVLIVYSSLNNVKSPKFKVYNRNTEAWA